MLEPILEVLRHLGGSGSIQEIEDELFELIHVPADVAELPHGDGPQTEVGYRAAWARTYLKKAGLIDNSERGVWALTPEGAKADHIDSDALVRDVRKQHREQRGKKKAAEPQQEGEELDWKDRLQQVLQKMDPIAFERLSQRLLRESGFIEVEVTDRSGDGGIDGFGTIRIGGLISFNVLFQSKRYASNIGPSVVRDFRGAMVGRADKGLIITTGGFTREARREATRDGAPPIDLIDGDLLAEKLKELRLGIRTVVVEDVEIDEAWFEGI